MMFWWVFFVTIAAIMISAFLDSIANKSSFQEELPGVFAKAIIFLILGAAISHWSSPKAIDVYRGETTLKVTYKDNVPVDSVVVFK